VFLRTNYVIPGAWAMAFAVLVAADLTLVYRPGAPAWMVVIATVLARLGAAKFNGWYPRHARHAPDAGFAPSRTR
jgi:hypothetical protein